MKNGGKNNLMKWISVKERQPEKHPILVFCKICQTVHSVIYDYDSWRLSEDCDESGNYYAGTSINFDYWMEQPGKPVVE
jgi:hypothetical protein